MPSSMPEARPQPRAPHHLSLDGAGKKRVDKARPRLAFVMVVFLAVYGAIAARLVLLALDPPERSAAQRSANETMSAARPDVVDRNGSILATDVRQPSLFAEPRRLIDVDEAAEQLVDIFPDLRPADLRARLASGRGFVWIRREITPQQQARVHALGLPGVGFLEENRRVYPGGRTMSHVIGHVNVDNQGTAGLEKWIDGARGLDVLHQAGFALDRAQEPVRLSVDVRVQHAMRDVMVDAIQRYQAIAGAAILMHAQTGEIVGMVSLPDYDPHDAREALLPDRINRATTGVFELGSIMKTFTTAMALDSGRFTMQSTLDARAPLTFGSMRIDDFRGQRRVLTLPEVFTYSSNVGTARMALALGADHQRAFLQRLGLLDRLRTELPESAEPLFPRRAWKPVEAATISFGHGMSVAPLQAIAATAALMNGGWLLRPTFEPRTLEQARAAATRVVSERTSDQMRQLFRQNVERGTGRRADAEGFLVGGKTGTSEKVVDGRYARDQRMTSFLAAFPMDAPQYVLLVMLDEPKPVPETNGAATAGVNATPAAGRIVQRVAPLLGVQPRIDRLAGAQPFAQGAAAR
jgi:cell division protein FtsI (penicillin-binding protein 3)